MEKDPAHPAQRRHDSPGPPTSGRHRKRKRKSKKRPDVRRRPGEEGVTRLLLEIL